MNAQDSVHRDFTHAVLSLFFICLLIASTFFILKPFLVSVAWGAVVVVATWPALQRLQSRLGNSRRLAVLVMATALLLIVLIPLSFAVLTIAKNSENIAAQVKSFDLASLSSPQQWLECIPLVGAKLSAKWKDFISLSPEEQAALVTPYAQKTLRWFLSHAGSTGMMMVSFLLTMVVSVIFYAKGEVFGEALLSFARRLGGSQGEEIVVLAAKTTRGVVMGIVLTALTQAAIGGLGLIIAGVPAASLLTAVMLFLCLAQLGPFLVLIPSVIWLYWSGHTLWGTVLVVFAVVAGTVDNVLRPYLIKKGANLPLLLIFAGVIGGLIAFGVLGLFIAPVILAVAYTLFWEWISEGEQPVASP